MLYLKLCPTLVYSLWVLLNHQSLTRADWIEWRWRFNTAPNQWCWAWWRNQPNTRRKPVALIATVVNTHIMDSWSLDVKSLWKRAWIWQTNYYCYSYIWRQPNEAITRDICNYRTNTHKLNWWKKHPLKLSEIKTNSSRGLLCWELCILGTL